MTDNIKHKIKLAQLEEWVTNPVAGIVPPSKKAISVAITHLQDIIRKNNPGLAYSQMLQDGAGGILFIWYNPLNTQNTLHALANGSVKHTICEITHQYFQEKL